MTSLAAVVALTYNSVDIQDIDGIFLELFRGGPGEIAEVRGQDDTIPGLDGRMARNRRIDKRTIELRGFVRGTGSDEAAQRADYWANRLTLAGLFDPTDTADLVAVIPGGDEYTIGARTLGGQSGILYNQIVPSQAIVSIVLESIDPDWVQTGT